ncbi:MAG: glycosyltransferase family 4 protein [Deltaproteobacteria bacterium]|nr:glycosyltransferase family 4 protein [Deltaproteobacteria bacterium]
MKENKVKIILLITEDWYFWSHRLPIARAARDAGFEVLIATRVNQHKERIEKEGFQLIPISLERRSKNIIKEIISILEIVRIYRREKPDIVHHVAVKPVLYGSWAAMIAGISGVVNALAGLGFIFVAKGWAVNALKQFVAFAFHTAFSAKNTIGIFQNPEDLKLFVDAGIVKCEKAALIRGSGVDTARFIPLPELGGIPSITLASRMLWDKGVGEFVEAAKILKRGGIACNMILVGNPDLENPASIPEETLRGWQAEGIVEWWGYKVDMPKILSEAHIVALPTTYGEGVPKVLIEAASCGRAIVATDVPGCREIVRHNENGFLVPSHDPKALADAIKFLIENPEIRARMGTRGRKIVKAEFSEEIVVRQTMAAYGKILSQKRGRF